MGTYAKNKLHNPVAEWVQPELRGRVRGLLKDIGAANRRSQTVPDRNGVSIGLDAETEEEVFWNPDPWNDAIRLWRQAE